MYSVTTTITIAVLSTVEVLIDEHWYLLVDFIL